MSEDIRDGQGRFLRIEAKLDGLVDDFADFRVEMAQRLTKLEASDTGDKDRVSMGTYKWMKMGIIASFVVGAASVGIRLIWG